MIYTLYNTLCDENIFQTDTCHTSRIRYIQNITGPHKCTVVSCTPSNGCHGCQIIFMRAIWKICACQLSANEFPQINYCSHKFSTSNCNGKCYEITQDRLYLCMQYVYTRCRASYIPAGLLSEIVYELCFRITRIGWSGTIFIVSSK